VKETLTEKEIQQTLKRLSKQRVAFVLQPGNVWIIDNVIEDSEKADAALKTCHMRGWVEPIEKSLPRGKLTPDQNLPAGNMFTDAGPLYRLTEAGWSVINRTHGWSVFAVVISILSFAVSALSLLVAMK
jgi:hypothetical protein